MRILLVKPHPELLVARRLQEGFLHLEPLELEIVAGGVPKDDDVTILDLSVERHPIELFQEQLHQLSPDMVGFTAYSTNVSVVKKLTAMAKAYSRAIVTVVGGVHATLLPVDYAVDSIDIIVEFASINPEITEIIA